MTDEELMAAALGGDPAGPGADSGAAPAGEIAPRRQRHGGRATGERSRLPQQRPWAQPRIRYAPTEILSADELESIHVASLRVLDEIGMDFLDEGARELLRAAGARVEPGSERVRFDLAMVEERYQPPDHPIRLQFPEGRYLKFYVLRAGPGVA